MRIFKNKAFHRWAKDIGISNQELKNAIIAIGQGSYEANLGGQIYKKRIAIDGRGKSGGVRTIVAFKLKEKAFFIYGYAKNERSNITEQEELALKALAKIYFSFGDERISLAIQARELFEVE